MTAEKIDRYASKAERRYHKRSVRRARRRQEKRDVENAGKKLKSFVRGWIT